MSENIARVDSTCLKVISLLIRCFLITWSSVEMLLHQRYLWLKKTVCLMVMNEQDVYGRPLADDVF